MDDGTVTAWGWSRQAIHEVSLMQAPYGLMTVFAIAAGGDFSLALQATGLFRIGRHGRDFPDTHGTRWSALRLWMCIATRLWVRQPARGVQRGSSQVHGMR